MPDSRARTAQGPMAQPTPEVLLPRVVRLEQSLQGGLWTLVWSADIDEAVRRDGVLQPPLVAALEQALAVQPDARWRTTVDAAGTLFAVAVHAAERQIALGSPRFATEQTIALALRDQPHDAAPLLAPDCGLA